MVRLHLYIETATKIPLLALELWNDCSYGWVSTDFLTHILQDSFTGMALGQSYDSQSQVQQPWRTWVNVHMNPIVL